MRKLNCKQNRIIIAVAIVLIAFGVFARLLPHPPNFSPIIAIALFGALYLPKRWAIIMPIAALAVSDYFIGFYDWKILAGVYLSFILAGLIGFWIRKRKNAFSIIGGSLAGALAFFLITNAAVWLFSPMYPSTLPGLIESYTAAIPFFRNSLAGDLFYVTLFVGSMELVLNREKIRSRFRKTLHAPNQNNI